MIELNRVSFGYIKQPMLLLDVNIKVNNGTLFVFGQKGAGKTSLLELICGMQNLYVGDIKVCGSKPQQATNNITYLPTDVVALNNKTVLQNLQYACDAINKDYSAIDVQDDFVKEFGNVKFKKLSDFNKVIFAFKRAKIKNAKVVLIDVNLNNFSDQEIQKYSQMLTELSMDKNKLLVISVSAEDFKKLQINAKKSEICYIFATKVYKFNNFAQFCNNAKFMGMAEYMQLNNCTATIEFTQSGYILNVQEKVIKIDDKYVEKIKCYFDDVTTKTQVEIFSNLAISELTDSQFNLALQNGDILLYDKLTTERLN